MRPQLLLMTYAAYGGTDPTQLIDLGAVLELHHQFLLVHDDLVDHDTIRYNGPNVVGYYQAELSADNQAVADAMGLLAGDLLFSFAHKLLLESESYSNTQKAKLLTLMNDINVDEVYGQQLDSYNIDPSPDAFSTERLTLIHTLKSARYTTQLPMQCAAITRNLRSSERKKIDDFAVPFGVLFQLVDDYSDYFVSSSVSNKQTKFRDYRQGKVTYPLHIGLAQASKQDVAFLYGNLGDKDLSNESMTRIVSILETSGAKDASRTYIDAYFEKAYSTLDKLRITPESKAQFATLIDSFRV